MTRLPLPDAPRILIVALRRLGDVLLATPLIRSVRCAWPHARIEALVFAETAGILDGNPDLDSVITMPTRSSLGEGVRLALRLAKRYDLAISTQGSDRPTIFALVAGRRTVGLVETRARGFWKRLLLTRSVPTAEGAHRVEELLRLADALGIARMPSLVAPTGGLRATMAPQQPYAVIHAAPMYRYKRWTEAGWRVLAAGLAERGLSVVATGGPADRAYLDEVWRDMAVQRLDGQLGWPEIAALLAKAQIYVGPDTSVTHLAAASGCPTVALYGPTDPRLWGPWPVDALADEWAAAGTIQRRGNVWLVQNPLPCLPCQQEGCARHLESYSQCLDELTPQQVLAAVDQALRRD